MKCDIEIMFYNLTNDFHYLAPRHSRAVFAAFYPVFRFYFVTGQQLTAEEGGGSQTHSQIEEDIKHSFCRVVLPFLNASLTKLFRLLACNANDK